MSLLYRPSNGEWVAVPSTSYVNEEELRTLLVKEPRILPLDELPNVESTTRVTVGREASLGSGYADVIWVDVEGSLTIIEAKLRSNPESRREVLAQALSYAAFLEGMSTDEFVERVTRPYLERFHGAEVAALPLPEAVAYLAGADVDTETFWEGLDRSLTRGDFTVLVVVDEPHLQLRRSVAYVNSHADFELYLVEVGFYRSANGVHEVLSPRILDTVAHARRAASGSASQRHTWDVDGFVAQAENKYPGTCEEIAHLVDEIKRMQRDGIIDYRFGTGQTANMIITLPDSDTSLLWIRSSGSVQMPRYKLRELGYADEEITAFMDRIAEVSGSPRSKYSVQQEPQIVPYKQYSKREITDRIVDVLGEISEAHKSESVEKGDAGDG